MFRLKDESHEASDNLPAPDVIAQEIVDDLGGETAGEDGGGSRRTGFPVSIPTASV